MSKKVPNTICKNINCTHGEDGGRRHYYTCRYCVRSLNWRSVACSEECYDEYMDQIKTARSSGQQVDVLPERTDMTHDEVVELVHNADSNIVILETKAELAEELEENPDMGYGQIVDGINAAIASGKRSGRKTRK